MKLKAFFQKGLVSVLVLQFLVSSVLAGRSAHADDDFLGNMKNFDDFANWYEASEKQAFDQAKKTAQKPQQTETASDQEPQAKSEAKPEAKLLACDAEDLSLSRLLDRYLSTWQDTESLNSAEIDQKKVGINIVCREKIIELVFEDPYSSEYTDGLEEINRKVDYFKKSLESGQGTGADRASWENRVEALAYVGGALQDKWEQSFLPLLAVQLRFEMDYAYRWMLYAYLGTLAIGALKPTQRILPRFWLYRVLIQALVMGGTQAAGYALGGYFGREEARKYFEGKDLPEAPANVIALDFHKDADLRYEVASLTRERFKKAVVTEGVAASVSVVLSGVASVALTAAGFTFFPVAVAGLVIGIVSYSFGSKVMTHIYDGSLETGKIDRYIEASQNFLTAVDAYKEKNTTLYTVYTQMSKLMGATRDLEAFYRMPLQETADHFEEEKAKLANKYGEDSADYGTQHEILKQKFRDQIWTVMTQNWQMVPAVVPTIGRELWDYYKVNPYYLSFIVNQSLRKNDYFYWMNPQNRDDFMREFPEDQSRWEAMVRVRCQNPDLDSDQLDQCSAEDWDRMNNQFRVHVEERSDEGTFKVLKSMVRQKKIVAKNPEQTLMTTFAMIRSSGIPALKSYSDSVLSRLDGSIALTRYHLAGQNPKEQDIPPITIAYSKKEMAIDINQYLEAYEKFFKRKVYTDLKQERFTDLKAVLADEGQKDSLSDEERSKGQDEAKSRGTRLAKYIWRQSATDYADILTTLGNLYLESTNIVRKEAISYLKSEIFKLYKEAELRLKLDPANEALVRYETYTFYIAYFAAVYSGLKALGFRGGNVKTPGGPLARVGRDLRLSGRYIKNFFFDYWAGNSGSPFRLSVPAPVVAPDVEIPTAEFAQNGNLNRSNLPPKSGGEVAQEGIQAEQAKGMFRRIGGWVNQNKGVLVLSLLSTGVVITYKELIQGFGFRKADPRSALNGAEALAIRAFIVDLQLKEKEIYQFVQEMDQEKDKDKLKEKLKRSLDRFDFWGFYLEDSKLTYKYFSADAPELEDFREGKIPTESSAPQDRPGIYLNSPHELYQGWTGSGRVINQIERSLIRIQLKVNELEIKR